MNKNKFSLSLWAMALLFIGVVSCKDDFTEEDLVKQQEQAKKTISASDSLNFLMAMSELEYRKYIDSLKRADSLALQASLETYLPYTYEVQVVDGSNTVQSNGRTEAFAGDVTVTITQYGVKQTATGRDGLFTFKNIGVGTIHGVVTSNGYTTFEWQVDATLPYQFFKESTGVLSGGTGGTGGAGGGTGGQGSPDAWYYDNPYALKSLLKYFNQRSFGNSFAIFATSGPNTNTVSGRAFIETNLTNRTKEVVPTGTTISAYLDVNNAAFRDRFIVPTGNLTDQHDSDPTSVLVNSIFSPRNYAYTFLNTAATDASGDFSLTLPSSPDGIVPIRFEYSDVVANKTFFIESNGDVTAISRRNVYGQGITQSTLPTISTAPTVSFVAGGGATATATISGNGSISDIDLTAGGRDFQGTPRVLISAPNQAGGVQATATATVTGGVVTGITVVNAGSGYTSSPTITITEGTGGLAQANGFVVNATNGGVANVAVTNPGTPNFVPNIVFWYDLNTNGIFEATESLDATNFPNGVNPNGGTPFTLGTNFPAATAVLNGSGVGVASVNVTNTGGGLSQAPNVLITSGNFATGTATVTGGVITAVTITNAGRYYATAPTISLPVGTFGAGTTTAVLTPTITSGTISGVTITNPGAGYNNGTFDIVITPRTLGGAAVSVVWQGLGISDIQVTNQGTIQPLDNKYYTNVPRVVIGNPNFNGTGSAVATATAVLGQDGRLIGINVTNPGFGYTSFPTVTIVSGTGAAATATFADKAIQEIDVVLGGSGYLVAPAVLIVDATKAGSGATATANITNGVVTSITLTNAGTGYINGANVIILDPGTTYQSGAVVNNTTPNSGRVANVAQGNVIVQNGVITGIEVYRAGDNYPAGTEVRIASTRGTGAAATSTVAAGKITAVTVSAGGTQYTGNNYYVALAGDIDPNVAPTTSFTAGLGFSTNPSTSPYLSKSGVRKIMDIHYGTGANRD